MVTRRIAWIDSARGLGIVLVVLGHVLTTQKPLPAQYIIYTFHMPLFLFLTTIVMKMEGWSSALPVKAKALLLPYASYLLMIGVPIAIWHFYDSPGASIKFVGALALGGSYLTGPFTAFWYMPALFIVLLTYLFLAGRLKGERSAAFIAAMVCIVAVAYTAQKHWIRLPYSVHAVPGMLCFVWIGRLIPWAQTPRALSVASFLMIGAAVAFDRMTPGQSFALDMKSGVLGLPVVGMLLAVAGAQMTFVLARFLDALPAISRGLQHFGRITVPILFLHQPAHFAFAAAGVTNQLVLVLIALALPVLFAATVRRWWPEAAAALGIRLPKNHAPVAGGGEHRLHSSKA